MGPFVILLLFLSYSAAQTCPSTTTCANNAIPGSVDGTCVCNDGFTGDGTNEGSGCSNINECALGIAKCVDCCSGGVCVDTPGSFECSCMAGYTGDGELGGTGCSDINECDVCNNCVGDAFCVNTPGSYDCVCLPGFEGDGFPAPDGTGCTDIDECLDPTLNNCVDNSTCINYDGGYRCECPDGYEGDGLPYPEGTGCTDIDECSTGLNDCPPECCGSQCVNTNGSYYCICLPGYAGDGYTCVEVKCDRDRLINKQTWNNGVACPWRIDMSTVDNTSNPMINGLKHNQLNPAVFTTFDVPDPDPVFLFFFIEAGDFYLYFLEIFLTNNLDVPVNVTTEAYYGNSSVTPESSSLSSVLPLETIVVPANSGLVRWRIDYNQFVDAVFYIFDKPCSEENCFIITDFNGEYYGCDTGRTRVNINPSQGSGLVAYT